MQNKLLAGLLLVFLAISSFSQAQTFPQGFNQVLVAAGLTQPTTMAIAPDGRFFIVQQNGKVKILKNGVLLPQSFLSMTVCTGGERGLLGIAIDPQFDVNNYVYIYYTIPGCAFNRVSRVTASGDTVVPGSETILLDLDTLIAVNHGGGHLDFGPDGKLYIATGENERPYLAQNLDSYLGKILRINPDGSTPADNPFPAATKRKNVWAYGLRNPFTFEFQPGTGRMFVGDVGDTTWEEINEATLAGGNFGWPIYEGHSTDTAYEDPHYVYVHGTGDSLGCAITGGTFFNPDTTNYPPQYLNRFYFIDYCGNWINSISVDSTYTWSHMATNIANYSVCIKTGPDGNLYFLSRNNEALYKVTYTPDSVPSIITDPLSQTISVGSPVTFSATASGLPPLSYQWRKNGVAIPGATNNSYTIPVVIFSDSGDYDMIVYNAYGADTSLAAHLTASGNQEPTAVIDTPLPGMLYSGGDTIYFSGTITDPEEGLLPDSMYAWEVVFHHETHVHPGPDPGTGISSGSFSIPSSGEVSPDVFYRLYLYAHDSDGAVDTSFVDILPRLSTFIVNTQPQGLMITVGGQPTQAPDTVLGVEGIVRQIGAPWSQLGYMFTHWSHGGTLDQTFSTPVNDTVFTANYAMPTLAYNIADTIVCVDTPLMLGAGSGYVTYSWSDGSVGEYLSLLSSVVDTLMFGITVTDSTGAAGSDSVTVIFDICDEIAVNGSETISVYPVPSGGEITISGLKENYYLGVTDVTGKMITSGEAVNANSVKTILLSPGVYSLKFSRKNNEVIGYRKVVIIR
jgi:glucose/arabinose dehydrogenase